MWVMKMYKTLNSTIAGFGGQGVMLIGQALAYAGADANINSLWYPSYGPETRGGTANCAVILSPNYINSPVFSKADVVMVLNKPSLQKFVNRVSDDGLLLYNSSLITEAPVTKVKTYGIPINEIASSLGNPRVSNMVMMGALLELTNYFTDEQIINALGKIFGEKKLDLLEINHQAIIAGRIFIKGCAENVS